MFCSPELPPFYNGISTVAYSYSIDNSGGIVIHGHLVVARYRFTVGWKPAYAGRKRIMTGIFTKDNFPKVSLEPCIVFC